MSVILLKISAIFLEFTACCILKQKLKVANYLGKTAVAWGSELTGIWGWASTDCSGFLGTFATQSAGQSAVNCRHHCLGLPRNAQQCVVTDLLCCFVSSSTKTGDWGCQERMAVLESKNFMQASVFFACSELEYRRSLLMWLFCSEPFHHAHFVKTRENYVAGLCGGMLNHVDTRVSVSWVFSRRTRTSLFSLTFIYARLNSLC